LKNPFAVLIGCSDFLLQSEPLTEEQRELTPHLNKAMSCCKICWNGQDRKSGIWRVSRKWLIYKTLWMRRYCYWKTMPWVKISVWSERLKKICRYMLIRIWSRRLSEICWV